MNEAQVLGLDIGGTAIKLGRFDCHGHCLAHGTLATPHPAYPQAVVTAIAAAIPQVDPHHQAIGLGVGMPGPADAAARVARIAINLEGWVEVPLADLLEQAVHYPTTLANDANCAGLGEAWLGAGIPFSDFLLLTLGTGVGGAIIFDKTLYVGKRGAAGDLGLTIFNPEGPPCNSGNRGSLEQYFSATAIVRQTGFSPAVLAQRADAGDPAALQFWADYGRNLGIGLASLTYAFSPEAIILGGGVSASFERFYPTLRQEFEQRVLWSSRENLQILQAALGNRAGMIGAAKLALDRFAQHPGQI